MLFRRKSKDPVGAAGHPQSGHTEADVRSCPSLTKALKKLGSLDRPTILDLGPLCGSTAVFLANRGARVSVEDFEAPRPLPKKDPRSDAPPQKVEPFRIDHPSDTFDLVLAWEAIDFTPPDRLAEVIAEIKRLVREKGYVFLLSRNTTGARKETREAPGRFRVEADDKLVREPAGTELRTRWVHPTREIERALKPFSVQGIHLQRDQTREILALRKAPRPPRPKKRLILDCPGH